MPLPQDSVYVLLPLDAQREKHFEEKFAKEQSTTFWYQDEKGIVSLTIISSSCMSIVITSSDLNSEVVSYRGQNHLYKH